MCILANSYKQAGISCYAICYLYKMQAFNVINSLNQMSDINNLIESVISEETDYYPIT